MPSLYDTVFPSHNLKSVSIGRKESMPLTYILSRYINFFLLLLIANIDVLDLQMFLYLFHAQYHIKGDFPP